HRTGALSRSVADHADVVRLSSVGARQHADSGTVARRRRAVGGDRALPQRHSAGTDYRARHDRVDDERRIAVRPRRVRSRALPDLGTRPPPKFLAGLARLLDIEDRRQGADLGRLLDLRNAVHPRDDVADALAALARALDPLRLFALRQRFACDEAES